MVSAKSTNKMGFPVQLYDREPIHSEVPAKFRAELNSEADRDMPVRMEVLAQELNFRPDAPVSVGSYATVAWMLGTLAIVALLTTGLIAAIALSV